MVPPTTMTAEKDNAAQNPSGLERRRQPRIQIVQPVRVRPAQSEQANFEEVSRTVNVSRGGLYFTSALDVYQQGMQVLIAFPYLPESDTPPKERSAEIVRVVSQPDGQFGVALRFLELSETRRAPAGDKSVGHPRHSGNGHRPVVLGVDGDRRTLNLLRSTLEAVGYEVRTATTGEEALEELRPGAPDLLFIELHTPGLSGIDLCHIIKKDEHLQKVPLILLTSSGSVSDYRTARELGAMVCMPKPLKAERLLPVTRLFAPVDPQLKSGRA